MSWTQPAAELGFHPRWREARAAVALAGCCAAALVGATSARAQAAGAATPVPPADVAPSHPPPEIALAELDRFAATHAPRLRAAREREGLGRAAREAAAPLLHDDPELQIALGPRFGTDGAGNDYDFSAALSQRFEISGAGSARTAAAERLSERLVAELDQLHFELLLELKAAYRSAQIAGERALLGARVVQFATDALQVAERRLAAGDTSLIELRLAQGELARARADHARALAAQATSRLRLCELTGWPSDRPPRPSSLPPSPSAPPALEPLLDASARDVPALRARRAQLAEARARVQVADDDGWVRPALGAQVVREGSVSEAPNWLLLMTLEVPLPLWAAKSTGERAQARAERDIALAEWSAASATRASLIRRAHASLLGAAERATLLGATRSSFEDSLNLLRRGLEAGELPLLEVSVARERFLATELDALAAREELEQAEVELEAALGHFLSNPGAGGTP